jgi:hypothetical protein
MPTTNYAKQSQITGCQNERMVFSNNVLWRFYRFETAEKQSQFKAKQSQIHEILWAGLYEAKRGHFFVSQAGTGGFGLVSANSSTI